MLEYHFREFILEAWDRSIYETLNHSGSGYEWSIFSGFNSAVRFESRMAARTFLAKQGKFDRGEIYIVSSPL